MKKKKQPWPRIKATENHGRTVYMVDARLKGKGERRFFDTRAEADGWAQMQRARRANEGASAFDDSRLAKYGWTVTKAIDFALEHLAKLHDSVTVSAAVDALVASKRGVVGETRLSDIENRLKRFSAKFEGRIIATVTEEEIKGFLDLIPHPVTRNDYRKEIVMLWQYATGKARKWASPLDTKNDLKRAEEPDKARIILTIDEAKRLMAASVDDDIRALNALVLFGGCRREEVEKMDWKHVDLRAGHINITADISKVSAERFAPIPDNLRAWLEPIAKKSGPIVSRNLMRPLRATWKQAKLLPWPQDAHRHSFISYRRVTQGDAITALEAGTSEKIIKRHYKRPVTKDAAEEYFQILPAKGGKILKMPVAA